MIRYTTSLDEIEPRHLQGFFVDWGWPSHPSPETHLLILQRSSERVLALDTSTGNVVGYITAITDGVLSAYIPLLEVLQDWQGQGIGSQLVQRMLARLDGFYMIDLLCDANLQPFYAKHGMQRTTGMLVRNYTRQTGKPE